MKNNTIILMLAAIMASLPVVGQELFKSAVDTMKTVTNQNLKMKPNTNEIEANFLSGYYNQDGNNSPVTGGVGTEELTDFANMFIVNVPLDSINAVSLFVGADAYTSASTDNIDSNVSSASSQDVRTYGTLSYTRKNLKRAESYGLRAGFSTEYDYKSFSAGFALSKEWNEGNTELNFTGQAFFDKWNGKEGGNRLIYPEFWLGTTSGAITPDNPYGFGELKNSNRNSYNAQLFLSQVLTTRLQVGISAELIYMQGLLSTPFHTVYFLNDIHNPDVFYDIERLPSSRLKIPLGVRLNYFPLSFLVLRTNYRYYTDDFGINAHTFEFETPIKIGSSFTVSPFYRYHTQKASKYFAPKYMHLSTSDFYTSDYDLSELQSHKYGVGLKYYPTFGLLRSRPVFNTHGVFMFKYVELRGAVYERSPSLIAHNISLNLGFGFK